MVHQTTQYSPTMLPRKQGPSSLSFQWVSTCPSVPCCSPLQLIDVRIAANSTTAGGEQVTIPAHYVYRGATPSLQWSIAGSVFAACTPPASSSVTLTDLIVCDLSTNHFGPAPQLVSLKFVPSYLYSAGRRVACRSAHCAWLFGLHRARFRSPLPLPWGNLNKRIRGRGQPGVCHPR